MASEKEIKAFEKEKAAAVKAERAKIDNVIKVRLDTARQLPDRALSKTLVAELTSLKANIKVAREEPNPIGA